MSPPNRVDKKRMEKIVPHLIVPDEDGILTMEELKEITKLKSPFLKDTILKAYPDNEIKKFPGSTNSSNIKFIGLKLKEPTERFRTSEIVLFCATVHEGIIAESMLQIQESVDMEINDGLSITTGYIHGVPTSVVICSERGQRAMYYATNTIGDMVEANYFYKWGTACVAMDCGTIVIVSESETEDRYLVNDMALDKYWRASTAVPCQLLRRASFEMDDDFPISRSPIISGVNLVDSIRALPYKIDSRGFLDGLSRRGAWRDGKNIGIVCAITTNFANQNLKQMLVTSVMDFMKDFFQTFVEKYFI